MSHVEHDDGRRSNSALRLGAPSPPVCRRTRGRAICPATLTMPQVDGHLAVRSPQRLCAPQGYGSSATVIASAVAASRSARSPAITTTSGSRMRSAAARWTAS